MEQLLALFHLGFNLFHAPQLLFKLFAVAPTVGGMELQSILQLAHPLHLLKHLSGQVVVGGGHVMASGHGSNGQSQTAAGLVPMVDFAAAL